MNDYSTRSATKANDSQEGTSSEEGSSTSRPEHASGRTSNSFWARASRLLRPQSASSLRENIADALLTDAGAHEAFSPEERAMLRNILRFREVRVEDVMVPRTDIEAVDEQVTVGELMELFEKSGRSRMPVYSETLDDPRGMVHIRDLLAYIARTARVPQPEGETSTVEPSEHARFDLGCVNLATSLAEAGIVRDILFVPPSMHASDLLQRMQAARTQMALVIDEHGGTDGLVSHEDIVEMVIGDIDDEHDDEQAMFARISPDIIVADARIELEELAEAIGPDFDVHGKLEDVDTLGGLIFAELGHIPARGEIVQAFPGFDFHILEADARRIMRVKIVRKRAQARPSAEDPPAGPMERHPPRDMPLPSIGMPAQAETDTDR